MDGLNYNHLYYFWVTATEGNLTRASHKLDLAPSTVSAQIRALEKALGTDLFHRKGKRLVLTERGRQARGMCDQMFAMGDRLVALVRDTHPTANRVHLRVGITGTLNEWGVHAALKAALARIDEPVHLTCRSDEAQRLLADLALGTLDVVLGDEAVASASDGAVEAVLLARQPLMIVGTPGLVEERLGLLPFGLVDAPVIMPATGTLLRREVDEWFGERGIVPRVVAELGDTGLAATFGRDGLGLFFVPAAAAAAICDAFGVAILGEMQGVTERAWAVVPRLDPHPHMEVVLAAASEALHRGGDS